MNRIEAYTAGGRITWDNVKDFWRDPGNAIAFTDEKGNYVQLVNMPVVLTVIKDGGEDGQ